MYGIQVDNLTNFKNITTNQKAYTRIYPSYSWWYYSEVPLNYERMGSQGTRWEFSLGYVYGYRVKDKNLPAGTVLGIEMGSLVDVYLDSDGTLIIYIIVPFWNITDHLYPRLSFYCDMTSAHVAGFPTYTGNYAYGIEMYNQDGKPSLKTGYNTFIIRGIISKSNKSPTWFSGYVDFSKLFFIQIGTDISSSRIVHGLYEYSLGQSVVMKNNGSIYVNRNRVATKDSWSIRDHALRGIDENNEVMWLICEQT